MDFIKKHFEKLLLAASLVILIGCAAYLAISVSKLSEEVQQAPALSRSRTGAKVTPLATGNYSNTITALHTPPLWQTNTVDPFRTKLEMAPVRETNDNTPPPTKLPTLNRVIRQPFKYVFHSYKQPGEDFAINEAGRNKTFFVKSIGMEMADQFEKTGYFINKFEQKSRAVYNKAIDKTNHVDISELTVGKPGNPPIVLILGKVAQEREPYASLSCPDNTEVRVRKGDQFKCGDQTYNVIDIAPTQVIIENTKSKEKQTIGLPGAKE